MAIENLTLTQLRELRDLRPELAAFADRLVVASYEEFVKILYADFDACVSYIEEDPKVRKDDKEDRLSSELIGLLKARNYDASHDETIGGHSDIVVRHPKGYLWVGEAKIHSSYEKVMDGFDQLNTRYLRGAPNADQGALIIYIFNKDVANVITTWSKKVSDLKLPDYESKECTVRQEFGFYNDHKHASGRKVKIRHVGVNLYWNPA